MGAPAHAIFLTCEERTTQPQGPRVKLLVNYPNLYSRLGSVGPRVLPNKVFNIRRRGWKQPSRAHLLHTDAPLNASRSKHGALSHTVLADHNPTRSRYLTTSTGKKTRPSRPTACAPSPVTVPCTKLVGTNFTQRFRHVPYKFWAN